MQQSEFDFIILFYIMNTCGRKHPIWTIRASPSLSLSVCVYMCINFGHRTCSKRCQFSNACEPSLRISLVLFDAIICFTSSLSLRYRTVFLFKFLFSFFIHMNSRNDFHLCPHSFVFAFAFYDFIGLRIQHNNRCWHDEREKNASQLVFGIYARISQALCFFCLNLQS